MDFHSVDILFSLHTTKGNAISETGANRKKMTGSTIDLNVQFTLNSSVHLCSILHRFIFIKIYVE